MSFIHRNRPIIQYLNKKYTNPVSKGIIKITNSSQGLALSPENLLNWTSNDSWVSSKSTNQSFIVDFMKNRVSIPKYGMRTYPNDHAPIKWKVFGSNNKDNWLEVDSREENLCEGHMGYVRDTDKEKFCIGYNEKFFDSKTNGVFRYIKVQQIGENSQAFWSSDKDTFLYMFYLNAFEVIGEIYGPDSFILCSKNIKSQTHLFFIINLLIL